MGATEDALEGCPGVGRSTGSPSPRTCARVADGGAAARAHPFKPVLGTCGDRARWCAANGGARPDAGVSSLAACASARAEVPLALLKEVIVSAYASVAGQPSPAPHLPGGEGMAHLGCRAAVQGGLVALVRLKRICLLPSLCLFFFIPIYVF